MQITNRKFSVEQFDKDQQAWIGNLLSPMNLLIQQLFAGLTNNITIQDNLFQEVKEVTFVNNTGNFPVNFKTKFNKPPLGLYVLYCVDSTGAMPTSYPWPVWSYANQSVAITSIAGLTANSTYTMRFHVIYG